MAGYGSMYNPCSSANNPRDARHNSTCWTKPTSHDSAHVLKRPNVRYNRTPDDHMESYVTETETVIERVYLRPAGEHRYATITKIEPHGFRRGGDDDDPEEVTEFLNTVLNEVRKPLKNPADCHRDDKWRRPSSPVHERPRYSYWRQSEPTKVTPGLNSERQIRTTWLTPPARTHLSSPTSDIGTAMEHLVEAARPAPTYHFVSAAPKREIYREVIEMSSPPHDANSSLKSSHFSRPMEKSCGDGDVENVRKSENPSRAVPPPATCYGPVPSHPYLPTEAIDRNEAPRIARALSPPKTQFGVVPSRSSAPKGDNYEEATIDRSEGPKSTPMGPKPKAQFGMVPSHSSSPKRNNYNEATADRSETPKSTPIGSQPKTQFGMVPSHSSAPKTNNYNEATADRSQAPKSTPIVSQPKTQLGVAPNHSSAPREDANKETTGKIEAPKSMPIASRPKSQYGMVPPRSSVPYGAGYSMPQRDMYKGTIDSAELARRYGDNNSQSRLYTRYDDDDDDRPVIDSREAAKKYNGRFVF